MSLGAKPHGAGRSSYGFIDRKRFFEVLALKPSAVFLDLGCGRGDYALEAAGVVGPEGRVYGIDAWPEGLEELKNRAAANGMDNIETIRADLLKEIPLPDNLVDVCLLATVLHDLLRDDTGETPLREIARVLKPDGKLAVVEFKKIDESPGPPVAVRLSAEEVERRIKPLGFHVDFVGDIGKFHYMIVASRRNRLA
ncbi:MAG: Demethylmenaquinone methyltransferase [Syntrophorhabdaceae bacterium PtaU1.Bin034]|nr:MAG: Demethylmenaquinone methyltransferase [Syntrophorhabdaceae bacterium PtaU1.Bin034]